MTSKGHRQSAKQPGAFILGNKYFSLKNILSSFFALPRAEQDKAMAYRYSTDFKALNAMYVGDIGDGVCGFYANVYRHTVYCIHAPHPSKREGSF